MTIETRLLDKLEYPLSGCWLWTGGKNRKGYGRIWWNRKLELTHRVSYALFVGQIPPKFLVCHHCDTPSCVNPRHLFTATMKQNSADAYRKGRILPGPQHHASKVSEQDICEIKRLRSLGFKQIEIAKKFGVTDGTICRILKAGPNRTQGGTLKEDTDD